MGLAESLGGRVFEASSAREALAGAQSCAPQMILLGASTDQLESLAALREVCPAAARVLVLDEAKPLGAAECFAAGATDILSASPERRDLELALAREEHRHDLLQRVAELDHELAQRRGESLVGNSRPIQRVHDQIQRVASTPRTTVLVTGESGAGKSCVARAIHRSSARAQRPFVAVPCALPDSAQLETLLYGRSTSADESALARAAGGTLFLSGVEHLNPGLQLLLLELLQERTWRGGPDGEEQNADLRVIASTDVDLERLVAEGRFREDLLYRLNVLSIDVPPLRERRDDVPLLAEQFLGRLARVMGKACYRLAPEAALALNSHGWPGNLRELGNTLERGLIAAKGECITRADLGLGEAGEDAPELVAPEAGGENFRIRHMEEVLIRRALISAKGNRSETARLLGVNRTTLYNKLRTYEIDG